jgi:hypothetical protein
MIFLKVGTGVELLEKLLEAELLDLKSNQTKQHKELLLLAWTKERICFYLSSKREL